MEPFIAIIIAAIGIPASAYLAKSALTQRLSALDWLTISAILVLLTLWIAFASTVLFWLFAIGPIASMAVGHFASKMLRSQRDNAKLAASGTLLICTLWSAYATTSPDKAFGIIPAIFVAANTFAFALFFAMHINDQ